MAVAQRYWLSRFLPLLKHNGTKIINEILWTTTAKFYSRNPDLVTQHVGSSFTQEPFPSNPTELYGCPEGETHLLGTHVAGWEASGDGIVHGLRRKATPLGESAPRPRLDATCFLLRGDTERELLLHQTAHYAGGQTEISTSQRENMYFWIRVELCFSFDLVSTPKGCVLWLRLRSDNYVWRGEWDFYHT